MENLKEAFLAADGWAWAETIVRLAMAILGGAVLGWDRERRQKPAGLRTHMMVALGSAAFMLLTVEFVLQFEGEATGLQLDPTRSLAGIIGGIGFLGAGTIIEARGHVRGITTAASIWVVAAIGTACGLGLYRVAFTTVAMAFAVLFVLGVLERRAFDGEETH